VARFNDNVNLPQTQPHNNRLTYTGLNDWVLEIMSMKWLMIYIINSKEMKIREFDKHIPMTAPEVCDQVSRRRKHPLWICPTRSEPYFQIRKIHIEKSTVKTSE
jgi:hypothetical protein